ncbi:rhombosortase [Teredinibacter waterburyi]|uniref:rhombosortase n=1 Tax=Teredinibacter waterburyi TaxID=1500538 RepID=UPI00165ED9C4|nr:rhombosortase [Teredinibacter waterburyi]
MSYPNPSYLPENALKHGGWIFLLLLLGIFGDVLNPYLQYSRESISSGQVWRLLSGHIVHLGWFHSVINMLGWLGVVWVFRGLFNFYVWLLLVCINALAISAGLWFYNPELQNYAGLSGVLHGLLVSVLVVSFGQRLFFNRWVTAVALSIVFFKLYQEQQPGYDVNYLYEHMQAPVAVDAHLYGAVSGLAIAGILLVLKRVNKYRLKKPLKIPDAKLKKNDTAGN